ncbi:hypothetical protein [Streptomyces sp. NPDC006012]|uniref:hypothetical protein n=1 Tax=Streptomyces sp. NPDC006012 TaxID=3364739 RepID=UPI0036C84A57
MTEAANPGALQLRTVVAGRKVQEASTADPALAVDALPAFAARWSILRPGGVLLTATPPEYGHWSPATGWRSGSKVWGPTRSAGRHGSPDAGGPSGSGEV